MTHKACSPVLIIGSPTAAARRRKNRFQCAVEGFTLQQAVTARQYPVGTFGIQTADKFALAHGKGCNGLVAVMPGFRHTAHRLHRRELSQQRLQTRLFLGQLVGVRRGQQRATAAFLAEIGTGFGHKSSPFAPDLRGVLQ